MNDILNLPKTKNIIEFTNKEIFLWLKDHIEGWAKTEASQEKYFEVIKAEITRRNNIQMFKLTAVNIILSILMLILAIAIFLK